MPTGAVIGSAVIGAGASLGAAAMAGGDGASFAPRDLYREITDTLRAQEETAGRTFTLESEYQPRYQQLNLSNLRGLLEGQQGGERLEYYNEFVPATQAASGRYVDASGRVIDEQMYRSLPMMQQRQYTPEMVMEGGYNRTMSRMVPTERTEGLLDLYEDIAPRISALDAESARRQRGYEIEDLRTFGPQYREAMRSANPEQTRLRDLLYEQVEGDLANEGLSDQERVAFSQAHRAASQGRLVDTGEAGAAAETFYLADRFRQRRSENQSAAQRLIALDQGLYGDSMLQVLGKSSGTIPLAGSLVGQGGTVGSGAGPQYFGPNGYTEGLYDSNFNGQNAANISGANNRAALIGGGMSFTGNLLGSAMQSGLFSRRTGGTTAGGGGSATSMSGGFFGNGLY